MQINTQQGKAIIINKRIVLMFNKVSADQIELELKVPEHTQIEQVDLTQLASVASQSSSASAPPEFKPGNTPYLQYDNTLLNADQDWAAILCEILIHGLTMEAVAEFIGVGMRAVDKILANDYTELNFRAGARLATLHCRYYPEQYC